MRIFKAILAGVSVLGIFAAAIIGEPLLSVMCAVQAILLVITAND